MTNDQKLNKDLQFILPQNRSLFDLLGDKLKESNGMAEILEFLYLHAKSEVLRKNGEILQPDHKLGKKNRKDCSFEAWWKAEIKRRNL